MFAYSILVFEVISGWRASFLVGEFGFLWADLKSIFEIGTEYIIVTTDHPATSCLATHGTGGDIGMVVCNEKGGYLLCSVNRLRAHT